MKVTGYFVTDNSTSRCGTEDNPGDADDSEDEEVSEDEAQWLDMHEMDMVARGGALVNRAHLSRQNRKLQVTECNQGPMRAGHMITVCGYFQLVEPWWLLTLRLRPAKYGKVYDVIGYPTYFVRDDTYQGKQAMDEYLKVIAKNDLSDKDRVKFFTHVENCGKSRMLTLKDFDSLLEQLINITKDLEMSTILSRVDQAIKSPSNLHLNTLKIAKSYSNVMKIVPQILPKNFKKLLEHQMNYAEEQDEGMEGNEQRVKKKSMFEKISDLLNMEPWVFGFAQVLSGKHSILGMEAKLSDLEKSDIWSDIPTAKQDALRIYNTMKDSARRSGGTHMDFTRLPSNKNLGSKLRDFGGAITYLQEENIVIIESATKGIRQRIYLERLWKAEQDITEGLARLVVSHQIEPFSIQVDIDSSKFSKIKVDPDQTAAVHKIVENGVIVMSGKGGCGKTEVVSTVFMNSQEEPKECTNNDDHYIRNGGMMLEGNIDNVLNNETENLEEENSNKASGSMLCMSPHKKLQCETLPNSPFKGQGPYAGFMTPPRIKAMKKAHHQKEFDSPGKTKKDDPPPRILLTAPTGKAANLLGKRTGVKAYTMHQVIFSYFGWRKVLKEMKSQGVDTSKKEWHFRSVEVWVVDECSLVAVKPFSTLLGMLENNANLQKLVLLGDIHQLPSVEPGNFLQDVYNALDRYGMSIRLNKNYRANCELIIANASSIARKELPVFDSHQNFACVPIHNEGPDDVEMITITGVIGPFYSNLVDAIQNMLKGNNDASIMDHTKSQFVAFRNNDCNAINEACCKHYNKHAVKERNKRGKEKTVFRTGDKICCTRNGNVTATDLNAKPVPLTDTVRLCNGEIFYIRGDRVEIEEDSSRKRHTRILILEDPDTERLLEVSYRELLGVCKIKHAWARTIHTFQGSEVDTILYVVGDDSFNQNWQHVYTAVTRGRNKVYIITSLKSLQSAVRRSPKIRHTSLQDKLEAKFSELQMSMVDNAGPTPVKIVSSKSRLMKKEMTGEVLPSTSAAVCTGFDEDVMDWENDDFGDELLMSAVKEAEQSMRYDSINEVGPTPSPLPRPKLSFRKKLFSGSSDPRSPEIDNSISDVCIKDTVDNEWKPASVRRKRSQSSRGSQDDLFHEDEPPRRRSGRQRQVKQADPDFEYD